MGRYTVRPLLDSSLDLVKCHDVDRLNKFFVGDNLLLEPVSRHQFVHDATADLQFVDAERNWEDLRGAPDQAFAFNGAYGLLDLLCVDGVVPGLYVVDDGGLGNRALFLRLLLGVGLETLLREALLLLVVTLLVAEEIEVVVVGLGGGWLR